MYHNFFGIDIGKAEFAVAVHSESEVRFFPNNFEGFTAFDDQYKSQLSTALVVLETTGGYEMDLINYLLAKTIKVHRANTRLVKHFIRSTGRLGKSDAIDAKGLARYGFERHSTLAMYVPPDTSRQNIAKLTLRRQDLKKIMAAEKNRRQAPQSFVIDSSKRMIAFLEEEIACIDLMLKQAVEQNKQLQKEQQLLVDEIDGIGSVTALSLLALIPELGQLNRRQIASLAGLAPHPYESGQKIGYRKTFGGREGIKPILFMAAMTASRSKGRLGEFYRGLVARGKKKMVALTALMRKIIVIANAKIKTLHLGASAA